MKTREIKGVTHYLYEDVAEFRDYHDSVALVSDWRHSSIGNWVLTDDGQVCQVLHLGMLNKDNDKRKTYTFIRTVIGSFICEKNVLIKGPMRTNMHTFSSDGKSPSVRRKEKEKANNAEFLFAKYVAKGDDVVEAYMKVFPTNNEKYASGQAKMLLKTDRVRNLIREEIDKYLDEADITPSYLLSEMRNIVDKRDSSDRDKLSALNTLIKISGMMDTDKKTESLTLFQGFSQEQLNAIQKSKNKKLLEVKKSSEK